jgi:DNA (cytosine-5)-methyltransferase 1
MRSVELFAGCGGLALGLSRAGFRHELVVELDAHAVGTLRDNKKRAVEHVQHWLIQAKDVHDVDFSTVKGEVDLVAGGPPCQPFSIGGRHLGPEDKRNLWPEAIRAVRDLRPKAFLFENVRGLLRPAFAAYLDYLKLSLAYTDFGPFEGEAWQSHATRLRQRAAKGAKPTYKVVFRAINAADYGAPQQRHRAIAMGIRTDTTTEWSFPVPTHSRDSLVWSKYVSGTYWARHGEDLLDGQQEAKSEASVLSRLLNQEFEPTHLAWQTVRDAIVDLPVPTEDRETIPNHRLRPGARIYPRHTGSLWDQPAKALKAGDHGVPGGENMLVLEEGAVRYFTLREMARLQGFPDDFVFPDSWKRPIKQLGNAVPVQLGEAFGQAIANVLGRAAPRRALRAA